MDLVNTGTGISEAGLKKSPDPDLAQHALYKGNIFQKLFAKTKISALDSIFKPVLVYFCQEILHINSIPPSWK
jgi:hypothetical protein